MSILRMAVIVFLSLFLFSNILKSNELPWNKYVTREIAFTQDNQILTPGLIDVERFRIVEFPPDGTPVDLGLPHDGKDAKGNPLPALMGSWKAGFLFLDLNGNGRQDPREVMQPIPGKPLGPFVYNASYEDGTNGNYAFVLHYLGDKTTLTANVNARFRIVRMSARQAQVGRNRLLLIDDNGNGRYDDFGKDAMIVDQQPLNFLSRQVFLGNELHELLVHPAGQAIELRPLKNLQLSKVDPLLMWEMPQKSQNLILITLIVSGRDGSFSFDLHNRERMIPIGAYDIQFGLLQRAKEMVYLKSGERTSFTVEDGKLTSPGWGGPVTCKLNVSNDGRTITVQKPEFVGSGSERYFPVDWNTPPVRATLRQIYRDNQLNLEHRQVVGGKEFKANAAGLVPPVEFDWFRSDELEAVVEIKSGIIGPVSAQERFTFVYKRK